MALSIIQGQFRKYSVYRKNTLLIVSLSQTEYKIFKWIFFLFFFSIWENDTPLWTIGVYILKSTSENDRKLKINCHPSFHPHFVSLLFFYLFHFPLFFVNFFFFSTVASDMALNTGGTKRGINFSPVKTQFPTAKFHTINDFYVHTWPLVFLHYFFNENHFDGRVFLFMICFQLFCGTHCGTGKLAFAWNNSTMFRLNFLNIH